MFGGWAFVGSVSHALTVTICLPPAPRELRKAGELARSTPEVVDFKRVARLGPQAPRLRPAAQLLGHELVRALGPVAQQPARIARIDDLLDHELLGGAEG